MKNKENARSQFIEMVKQSWTYERMTQQEHIYIDSILGTSQLFGTYSQRWRQLNTIYQAFLLGCGFDGWNWREPKAEDMPF